MGRPEMQDRSSEKVRFLSVSSIDSGIDPRRGSVSSLRTTVAESTDARDKRALLQRAETQAAEVQLSWWKTFKALLRGPRSLKRALANAAHVKIAHPEDVGRKMFDHQKCDFFLTVTAFPNPLSSLKERQSAQCVIDTGCLQGNIISAPFAQRLGFVDYHDLKEGEENGGTVVTGHIHKPLGAVHVSWYHNTSARVFNNMRFLVSESATCDLVVGTHSIQRWSIVSPPNLLVELTTESNPDREALTGQEAKLDQEVQDAQRKLDACKVGDADHDRKKKRLAKKEKELEDARMEVQLFDAQAGLKRRNTDAQALRKEITKLEKKLKKHEKKKTSKAD